MTISLIMTVLNEGASLPAALESLAGQTRPPAEIVIADGGSRDNTLAVIHSFANRLPVRVISAPGANIAQGRNTAIRAARYPIIAVTDAGVVCAPDWLERLTAPVIAGQATHTAGFFTADPRALFEQALGAVTLPHVSDIDPRAFLPSSRSVCFTKAVWESAGGYPEWLDYCEDVVFDRAVRARHGAFAFVPQAVVAFRPRATLGQFFRQYFLYARGDGKANLFPKQHAVRYFAYLVAGPLVATAALTVHPALWTLAALAGLAYLRRPLQRVWPQLRAQPWRERLIVLAWLPVIRLVGDVAKMLGYPAGWWWRLKHSTLRHASP